MRQHQQCFHCGEALPDGKPIFAHLGNSNQPVCCIGCKAVAEFIHGSGLDAFYKHRSLRAEPSEWQIYDNEDLILRYVHDDGESAVTTIDIGGMYCAACVWLLDNALSRHDAIESVSVNPATHRAVIRWDQAQLSFARLLEAIAQVGFKPSPTGAGLVENDNDGEYRRALRRLIVAAAAGMQVMMFAVALYAGEHYGIEGTIEQFLRIISLLVCLPIVFYSARPFFAGAYRGVRARSPGMDLPVAIAITAAFVASVRATLLNAGDIYFDSVAMFVLFLSATRYLEMRARHRSEDYTQALANLLPETVTRISGDSASSGSPKVGSLKVGSPEVVVLDKLRIGDIVLIRPGDVIPADGILSSGELAIDESLLTGESHPVTRKSGMDVFAGGINRAGNASIEITLTGASTSLAEIGRLLERARADRPPIALLADRIAGKFVVAVLMIATATCVVWFKLDPSRAFEVVLATLVVTCPCALSLATPAALAASASRLAKDGFLLVRSRILEVLTRDVTIVFDKTGTLTEGRPSVTATKVLNTSDSNSEGEYLALAAEIETASEHVLARAFSSHYKSGRFQTEKLHAEPGCGVEALVGGMLYRIGSADYVCELSGTPQPSERSGDESTIVYLGNDRGLLARFSIGDELRSDAEANKLGIGDWHAALSPAAKLELLARLQKNGATVVMVGDGVNDAPVLAAADASIAIDAGTALARASADAIVLGKRIGSVVDAALIALRTRKVIRQNILWAILYNLTAVPLAASGMLAPWMAAIGMSASSLIVVLNALRLQRKETAMGDSETNTNPANAPGKASVLP